MDKIKLKEELTQHHANFINSIQSLPKDQWQVSYNQKWSAAQQLNHIILSVSPVKLAFSLPTFLLKLAFGNANRKSRSYDELIAKYHEKLKEVVHSLAAKIDSFSEEQLDRLILPHPLLGKLTFREMLYFTIYHVQHHHQQIKVNLPS
jgi:uncharacterized damage-inducible protein DinB